MVISSMKYYYYMFSIQYYELKRASVILISTFLLVESLNIFLIVFAGGYLKNFKLSISVLRPFIY